MTDFREKLHNLEQGKSVSLSALTFLSDLSSEDRDTLKEGWPRFPLERRRRIVQALANLAEENIELYFRSVFLIALDDSDPQVRLSAIEGLFEDDSKVLMWRLMRLMGEDSDSDVREAAATALGRFAYKAQCAKLGPDASGLREALLNTARDEDEENNVRRRAVESLGYLNGDGEVQELIENAYRRGGRDAESAVFAMGRNIDARWQQTILDELESDHRAMRYEAARAAGEMALEAKWRWKTRFLSW
jgi:HEAT repeat protein